MALGITLVVVVVVVSVIVAFFLLRPGGSRYARMADRELRSQNYVPPPDEESPVRPRTFKTTNGNTSLTPLIMGMLRAVIGLAAVGVLAYIYTSTQSALSSAANDAATTAVYTSGIFKAVIAIGITAALYIFTRFHR